MEPTEIEQKDKNRMQINVKNPIDGILTFVKNPSNGSMVQIMINVTEEGIIVDIWAETEEEGTYEQVASMYEFWQNLNLKEEE